MRIILEQVRGPLWTPWLCSYARVEQVKWATLYTMAVFLCSFARVEQVRGPLCTPLLCSFARVEQVKWVTLYTMAAFSCKGGAMCGSLCFPFPVLFADHRWRCRQRVNLGQSNRCMQLFVFQLQSTLPVFVLSSATIYGTAAKVLTWAKQLLHPHLLPYFPPSCPCTLTVL